MVTSYSYDQLSRLLSALHQVSGSTIDGASYTYDNAGNRLTKTNYQDSSVEQYAYDPLYQLTQVTRNGSVAESYSYDKMGNRLSSATVATYSYNSSNQLTSSSDGFSYTYDNNGNTATKTDASGTTQYSWDYENRLTSVNLAGGGTVTFKYDPFVRRIQKSGPSGTTNYVYDEANVTAEVDNTGAAVAHYTQDLGIDEPLATERSGTLSFYSADGLGSITSLTASSGALAGTFRYDAFGNLASSTGNIVNPYRYTGREYDSDLGLYSYRARYYESQVGRFTSEDPARINSGINFYAYVKNDPIKHIDPFGLADCVYSVSAHSLICQPSIDPGQPAIVGPNGPGAVQLGPGSVWSGLGRCMNDLSCINDRDLGPIVPGNYNMNLDDRPGHQGFWRLEPVPKIPWWKCYLGLERCGFELHPGIHSLGCITTNKNDSNAMQQYNNVNTLLQQENGNNHLKVVQ